MNNAQLLTTLAAANVYHDETPLPESIWADDLALREIERRTAMQTQEENTTREQPTRRTTRWLAAAAAAVVVVVGAAVVLFSNSGAGTPPAITDTTEAIPTTTVVPGSAAIEMTKAWVAALDAGDAESALALLHPDEFSPDAEGMTGAVEWLASFGARHSVEDCEASVTEASTGVTCVYVVDHPIMNALDLNRKPIATEYKDERLVLLDIGNRIDANSAFSSYATLYETETFDDVCNSLIIDGPSWIGSWHVLSTECGQLWAALAQDVAIWIEAGRPQHRP